MADKFLQMQQQLRHDNEDLQSYLRDLKNWEADIKQKDEALRQTKDTQDAVLPPIRNQGKRKPKQARKKKPKPATKPSQSEAGDQNRAGTRHSRIRAYDYRSWDKFDVDKACAEVDSDEEDEVPATQGENGEEMETDTDSEEERELERQRRIQEANMEKDKGNALFKQGKYEPAVVCYTAGMEADPTNAILPANRAMANLKLERFEDAERDCDKSISLDCTYIKAYARRAAARFGLGKLEDAKKDYQQVLNLEPSNKQASSEIKRIDRIVKDKEETERQKLDGVYNIIQAVQKPVHLRSNKPLKRMVIEEIGTGSGGEDDDATQTTHPHKPQHTTPSGRSEVSSPAEQRITGDCHEEDGTKSSETPTPVPSEVRVPDATQTELPPTVSQVPSKPTPPVDIPGIPSSSYQLQSDWKQLQKFSEQLFQYFKNIPPQSYKQLLQDSLDAALLMRILNLLKEQYVIHSEPVYETLAGLSQVKRFEMNVMFMSSKDKQVVQELFSYMERSGNVGEQELTQLRKKYQL
ncbi:RNA polymerase II-associated protein 3-like [Patiria miniata]|uniref:RNA polymerase II-associated protein 3 n=1 Tax=Patiria miniata TaxID=46514 RepID=A0A913ZTT6_PATMI|nr:RNA polymerase II-associated protein 3-like [Patiria miniata]